MNQSFASSFLGTLSAGWKSFTGMIRRWIFRSDTSLQNRPYAYLRQIRSQSASTIPRDSNVTLGFSRLDIAAAKVLVRRLVENGHRKGPTDLMVLPAHVVEQWLTDEAVRYLQEQKSVRQRPIAEI